MADALPDEKCGCGRYPRFDSAHEPDGHLSWFACPPAPKGCGRAAPPVFGDAPDRDGAAAAWDKMMQRDRGARGAARAGACGSVQR